MLYILNVTHFSEYQVTQSKENSFHTLHYSTCKYKWQYLLTLQVSRYCFLTSQSSIGVMSG